MTPPRPRPPSDPPHGTYARYVGKRHRCRCADCRHAEKLYQQRRELDRLEGRPRRAHAIGTVRRLQALMAIGWSGQYLASCTGVQRSNLPVHIRYEHISAAYAEKVRRLYDELSVQDGPSLHSRGRSLRAGFLPPEWWHDVDIDDPDALPVDPTGIDEDYVDEVAVERFLSGDDDVALTESERRAVAALLHAGGTPVTPIAERLHVGPERVTRWLALESTGKTA